MKEITENTIETAEEKNPDKKVSGDRRDFLKLSAAGLAASAFSSVVKAENSVPEVVTEVKSFPHSVSSGIPRTTAGYCWPQTARPGDSLDFMVSAYEDTPYQADLVRVICGNVVPAANTEKYIEVTTPFKGEYPGRRQYAYPGSFTEIPENVLLNDLESFTVQAFFYPTYLPPVGEKEIVYPWLMPDYEDTVLPSLEYHTDEQTLISRWDEQKKIGWSVYIDRNHKLSFKMANSKGTVYSVQLEQSLVRTRWFQIVASYDAENHKIRLSAKQAAEAVQAKDPTWPEEVRESRLPSRFKVIQRGPLRFGAVCNGPSNGEHLAPAQVLNGKLDSVRMLRGVATDAEVGALAAMEIPQEIKTEIVGFWDFAKGIGSTEVHDLSSNRLHGVNVNLPSRAVSGVHWNDSVDDWRLNRSHYSACHYHDDDLYDVQWSADFSYTVPESLPSGIYAARLKHGEFIDYIPFFVAPAKGKPTSRAAFLVPTLSCYQAYTNFEPLMGSGDWELPTNGYFPKENMVFSATHPEASLGPYRAHKDGGACVYASLKCPNTQLMLGDGYSKFNMDTYLMEWLYASGIDVDIITDHLLHQEGAALLEQYSVIMSGHHPEYPTPEMERGIEGYLSQGGNFMYLGGNGWIVRVSQPEDMPDVLEVRYGSAPQEVWNATQNRTEYGGVHGGFPPLGNHFAARTFGVYYNANIVLSSQSVPYQRNPDSYDARASFIFKGVDDSLIGDFGLIGDGAAGLEVDAYDVKRGSPHHALVLATTTEFDAGSTGAFGGTAKGDMVFFETASGGAVFSVGSMTWISSLNHNNYRNNISQVTKNVLMRFMDDTPFEAPKS